MFGNIQYLPTYNSKALSQKSHPVSEAPVMLRALGCLCCQVSGLFPSSFKISYNKVAVVLLPLLPVIPIVKFLFSERKDWWQ